MTTRCRLHLRRCRTRMPMAPPTLSSCRLLSRVGPRDARSRWHDARCQRRRLRRQAAPIQPLSLIRWPATARPQRQPASRRSHRLPHSPRRHRWGLSGAEEVPPPPPPPLAGTVAGGSGGGGVDSSLLGAIRALIRSRRCERSAGRAEHSRRVAPLSSLLAGRRQRAAVHRPAAATAAQRLRCGGACDGHCDVLAREIMPAAAFRLDEEELAASAREESRETSARSDEDAEGNGVTSPSENPSPPSRTTSLSKTPSFTHTFTRFERANSAFI